MQTTNDAVRAVAVAARGPSSTTASSPNVCGGFSTASVTSPPSAELTDSATEPSPTRNIPPPTSTTGEDLLPLLVAADATLAGKPVQLGGVEAAEHVAAREHPGDGIVRHGVASPRRRRP